MKKVFVFENSRNLHFLLDGACLEVDLARCERAMDMADGALEMFNVMLFSQGMGGVVVACFEANGSGFVSRLRTKFPIFSIFSRYVFP